MRVSRVIGALAAAVVVAWSLQLDNVKLSILVGVAASAIAALALDLLVARTGELSLAHGAFFGVGAFTAINAGSRGAPWPVSILLAMAVTAAVAAVVGLPSLRIRGLQVAIATLAFQAFAEVYLFTRDDVTAAGRALPRPPFLEGDFALYVFALAAVAVTLLVRHRVAVTRAGRSFLAVRDIEDRAVAFGIEPGRSKLLAYAISGGLAGLAGAVLAVKAGSISAKDPFLLLESLLLVAIVVVGGAGSAAGILTATVLVKGFPQFSTDIPFTDVSADRIVPTVSAALLVVVIVAAPEGIGGLYRTLGRRIDRWLDPRHRAPLDTAPQVAGAHAELRAAAALREVPRPLRLRMPVPALLEARDVRVHYGGVAALDSISLEVRRGEIVGLIGANGAGKSTFFNAVSGFAPAQGSIRFRGVELVRRHPSDRAALGVVRTFQDLGLVRAETVLENALLGQSWLARYPAAPGLLGLGGAVRTERDLRERARVALEVFGLEHLVDQRLGDLSYGTMRIVEIAAAVAAGPDLLMLDEATAGLGPEESYALGERFLALRAELDLTLVVVEHHVPLIARVCDYAYCLESGALIAEGPPGELTRDPQVVASFLGRIGTATGTGTR